MTRLRALIGAALRDHRHAQGRTLRQVADDAGISLTYLSEIERGHKEPSSEVLAALSDALGIVLSELLREVADSLARLEAARAATPIGFLPARRRAAAAPDHAPDRAARVVDLHGQLADRLRPPATPAPAPAAAPTQAPIPAGEPPAAAPAGSTAEAPTARQPDPRRPTAQLARVLDFQAYAHRRSA